MRVDFYQLAGTSAEQVIGRLAEKVLAAGQRVLVIAEEEDFLARLDRMLWDSAPADFLPHGLAGGADDARQPVLLSSSADAPNKARNLLIADGIWRDSALRFERGFFLFDSSAVESARGVWRELAGREGVERHYHAFEDGRWVEKG